MRQKSTMRKNTVNNRNIWRLNIIPLNNQWITEEIKKIKKISSDTWQWKHSSPQPMGHNKTSSKRKVYTKTIWHQETRKIPNKKPSLTPKSSRENRKPEVIRMKEIIKIRAEINEIEMKKQQKDHWNLKLILWSDTQHWQTFRLIKKKGRSLNKIKNDKKVTIDTTEIQRIIRDSSKKLYINKMDILWGHLEEINKLLEKYNLSKLNQRKIESMNRSVISTEIETVI